MHATLALALVLVATSALTTLAVLLIGGALRRARPRATMTPAQGGNAAFLFDGQTLVDTNQRGAALLETLRHTDGDGASDWLRLTRHLATGFPGLGAALAELPLARRTRLPSSEVGGTELELDWLDGALRLVLVDTRAEDGAVLIDRLSLRALQDELAQLRQITESAPLMAWREGERGQVVWANNAYLTRIADTGDCDTLSWPLPALFPRGDVGPTQRIGLSLGGAGRQAWFDVIRLPQPGGVLAYALPADEAHQAERAKRDFIQTLTKTFATLPIGLAVFDRTRRLQVFNPALTDLTGLEPEFLLSRPGIEGFLNRMRDKRVLPEPRDYRSWTRRLLDIESTGPAGGFEETWSLGNGQTFRVTVSPHPDGALAFLIEDITSETHLARHVREELETSQMVLNQIDAAIAVFATNGELLLTNTAFTRLWPLAAEDRLTAVTLPEAVETWRQAGGEPGVWARVAALARPGQGDGQPLRATMQLPDGEALRVDARRTPTGALMVAFGGGALPLISPAQARSPALRASA